MNNLSRLLYPDTVHLNPEDGTKITIGIKFMKAMEPTNVADAVMS